MPIKITTNQLETILDWIRSAPDTDEQDCDSTDWYD